MQEYQAIEMHEKAAAVAQGLIVFLRICKTSNKFFTNNKDWRPLLLWGIGEQSRSCEPHQILPSSYVGPAYIYRGDFLWN